MRRSLFGSMAVAIAIVGALTIASTSLSGAAVEATPYAQELCAVKDRMESDIRDVGRSLHDEEPAATTSESIARTASRYRRLGEALAKAADAIEALGSPHVRGGRLVVEAFVTALRQYRAGLEATADGVAVLPSDLSTSELRSRIDDIRDAAGIGPGGNVAAKTMRELKRRHPRAYARVDALTNELCDVL